MKNTRLISLITTFILLTSNIAFAKDYSNYPQKFWDLSKDHWAYEYISELVDKNVLNGYEDGSFKPEHTVLRAEWAKMMSTASGVKTPPPPESSTYAVDYGVSDWYYDYINNVAPYMNFYQDVNGDIYFKPTQAISREDVTVSLVKLKGYSVDNVDYSYITQFKDMNSISNNIKKYIAVAIERGLISGYEDNTFRGQDTLTRAEAATLLCRAFQMGNDNKNTMTSIEIITPTTSTPVETFSPTIPPVATPTPTIAPTPEATVVPTETPVVDVEDNTPVEEEKEPESTEKPYKVETLVKADVNSYNFHTFHDDNIYYLDKNDETIYSYNVTSREKETVIALEDIAFEYEGITYTDVEEVHNIYYDNYSDKLMIYGNFKTSNAFDEVDAIYGRCISVPDCEYVTDYADSSYPHILGATKNNKLAVDIYYGSPYVYDDKRSVHVNANVFYETNDCQYFLKEGLAYKYDFNEIKELHSFENVTSSAINVNGFCFIGKNKFVFITFDEKESFYTTDEIKVTDSTTLNTNNFDAVSYLTSNDDIIFYDTSAKAFRMISVNN